MYGVYYKVNNELYHHGIKGQKWGVRRFQNQNGTLTNAGKKRYSDSDSSRKSKHRLKLEEKYRKSGMSPPQAELAAERRIKTEKIVAAAAGLTLTVAAAYAANKYVKNNVDRIIKSGTTLQRIEMQDTGGKVYDTFYAAKNKADKTKYIGKLGRDRIGRTGHSYKMNLSATTDIKIAARKNAEKVFKDLYDKDPDFRKSIEKLGSTNVHGMNGIKITPGGSLKGKDLSKVYDNFNSRLVNLRNDDSAKKFYSALKSKGYGAVQDINDMKFSGYNAKNPLIIFGSKGKVAVSSIKEMSMNEVEKALVKDNTREKAKQFIKDNSSFTFGTAAEVSVIGVGVMAGNTKAINNYRVEHPNSMLSDKEILKILNKQ